MLDLRKVNHVIEIARQGGFAKAAATLNITQSALTRSVQILEDHLGIQVFDPAGKALGILTFDEQPANCTFGGKDNKTLYVTARTSVYEAPMEATGHVFPAGRR